MMPSCDLPTVASLWIGGSLGWLEQMCLRSFVALGQPVVLYHYEGVDNAPDGVELRDARSIWTPPKAVMENTAASYVADLFRLHLMQATDEIWIDTDIVAEQPLVPNDAGFLIGFTPWEAEVNNCVMRLPKDSATLGELLRVIKDPTIIPPWIRPAMQQRLERVAPDEREVARYHTLRTILGPKALTAVVKSNGEVREAQSPDVLSPVPWQYADVLFNPFGGWEGWFSANTRCVHLWSNMLKHHKRMEPAPHSYIGRTLDRQGRLGS